MLSRSRLNEALNRGQNRLRTAIQKALLYRRSKLFRQLVEKDKAWALYVMMIKHQIDQCNSVKLRTNYAKVSPEQKKALEYMDIEIETLKTMIAIPENTIKQSEIAEQENIEKELIAEVKTDIAKEDE